MKKKSFWKKGFFVLASWLFVAAILLVLSLVIRILVENAYGSKNSYVEWFKIIQFSLLVFLLISLVKGKSFLLGVLLGAFSFFFQFNLIIYFLIVQKRLDFRFLWMNKGNLADVLAPYFLSLCLVFLISFLCSYFLAKIKLKKRSGNILVVGVLAVFLLTPIFKGDKYLSETFFFIKSAFTKDVAIDLYQLNRDELIQQSIIDKKNLSERIQNKNTKETPKYLDNIIFLQLESVNGKLSSEEITPNFYQISKQGMRFSNYYANGVQTILGQENLLCSLPSSFYGNLNFSKKDKEMLCLPEIFKQLGYRTSFFKTYNLDFANTGEFMQNIGFEEIHAEDIMQENDPQYRWGYREDFFYKRAFSHIEENFQKQKNFLFLEVGPTNHWPFITPAEYTEEVPYKNPLNQKERLENTMFLQDKQLAVAWNEIQNTFPEKNYTVVIVGDHSWPTGEHPDNEFCGSGAFEENFKTDLSIVFGDSGKGKGRVVEEIYSHMDILPSFMDLLGIEYSQNKLSNSFFQDKIDSNKRQVLLVQPFSERFLAFINTDFNKHLYNSKEKSWSIFDLEKDSDEKKPFKKTFQRDEVSSITEKFLPLVQDENIIMHALGEINGFDYTNSKEAFEKNLEKKRKQFEVDISLSSDEKIIVSHEGKSNKTEEEFLKDKIEGIFTPLSLTELMQKMEENPDIILVTDIKSDDYQKTARILFGQIKAGWPDLLKRVIPQVYDKKSFEMTKNELGFEKMAYTLYKETASADQIFEFVQKNEKNIPMVVMSKSGFNEKLNSRLKEIGIKTFVHTLNDRKEISKFRKLGVDGIFTDSY